MQLRPKDLWTIKYWLHLVIISFIVLAILQWQRGGDMLNTSNVFYSMLLIGIADITAHTILGID